ncbi:flagellar hook-associated protein FlgL [Candidatus Trichorickettsia mobilis]|jgi:hypothetical protein|uniref:Flagellar hook-associated protein FlgL n=1 Tax=Candidatus Trichorickettsia mobilis TaxID=1346319 RepID=A0ABZ0USR8_9RICK|nr:hypothetical protein [Candidatus Trichorickettsia mobilis]WPY01069.1 flagellar hook-associated protein FlgL [Candidatus Trichorickettsia mobilis]
MTNSFHILDIINTIPNSSVSTINKAKQGFVEASKGDTRRYDTQDKLRDSGTFNEFHRIQSQSAAITGFKLNITTTTIRLGQERDALTKIIDVITRLKEAIPDNANAAGTFTDKANAALPQIQELLNIQIVNGSYLFGGVDSKHPPCGDLVAVSNLDADGDVTTNYTTSAPNPIKVQVSELGTVTVGNIYAGMAGVAQAIGAMNLLKAPIPDPVAIDEALNQATALLGQAIALIGIEQDKLKAATADNDSLSKRNIQTITEVFQREQPEIAAAVKNAGDGYGFSLKIFKAQLNTLQRIFDIF